jgi:hypothetical protein
MQVTTEEAAMTSLALPPSAAGRAAAPRGTRRGVVTALTVWLLLVLLAGAAGAFVAPPGTPPVGLALAVAVPLLLYFAALQRLRAFREFVLSFDLRLVAAMQAWRWAGLGFLALYAHNILPAVFALPAGLGDMAIGLTAPWIMLALLSDADFAAGGAFRRWNILGIADLVIAVGIGTLSTLFATGVPGEISTAPMATLPLLLIPAFLVPLFLMLHATALLQSRQLVRGRLASADR